MTVFIFTIKNTGKEASLDKTVCQGYEDMDGAPIQSKGLGTLTPLLPFACQIVTTAQSLTLRTSSETGNGQQKSRHWSGTIHFTLKQRNEEFQNGLLSRGSLSWGAACCNCRPQQGCGSRRPQRGGGGRFQPAAVGVGEGVQGTPTYLPQNDHCITLINLRYVRWGQKLVYSKNRAPLQWWVPAPKVGMRVGDEKFSMF